MSSRSKMASSRPAEDDDSPGNDCLAPMRRCGTRFVDCIVMSKYISMLFAMLPAIYLSCVLMYINTPTGLPSTVMAAYNQAYGKSVTVTDPAIEEWLERMVKPLTAYVGCLAGFTIIFGVLAVACIQFKWAGVLSICTWTVEAVGHWLQVTFLIVLLASQTAMKSMPDVEVWMYNMLLGIMVGMLLPGALAAAADSKRRRK